MGVAAPHWARTCAGLKAYSLNSSDPFSLQNALRYAASLADRNIGFWGQSNWKDIKGRKGSILLMNYFEQEKQRYEDMILSLRPNLLLIGSMTLSVPGAIRMAQIAKKILGDEVIIATGGKHATETIYKKNNMILHHEASLVRLMAESRIPKVFDMVIAGDGEEIIARLGEVLASIHVRHPDSKCSHALKLYEIENIAYMSEASGSWIASWVDSRGEISSFEGSGKEIDYNQMESPAKLFGVTANFPVFNTKFTAHAYSDMSKGCSFDCYFCSERRSINGSLKQGRTAARRLIFQFKSIIDAVSRDYSTDSVSAFVEDSILLGGVTSNLLEFSHLLESEGIRLPFGCQFTVDLILNTDRQSAISRLADNELKYIFWGLETGSQAVAQSLSKNIRQGSWINKNEQAIQFLSRNQIKAGVSVLFGQGESQEDRLALLNLINGWKQSYCSPAIVSLNWAVQHPLMGSDGGASYRYTEWGTPIDSPFLDIFIELFGEASTEYPISGVTMPALEELYEIKKLYEQTAQTL